MRTASRLASALVPFVLLCACTMDALPNRFQPSFREGPCPQALEPLLIPLHSCGFLTVLEDRARPTGPTIDLFVVRVEPQSGRPTDRYPMYVPGTNLATSHQFFDMTQAAERLQRETIIMEQRGVGYSRPSLDCPEVDAVSPGSIRAGIRDPKERAAFLDRVTACRTRLSDAGIDVSAYDLLAMAADAEDLRHTLQIDSWGLMSYGSASLVALEVLREQPRHVEQVILDSPTFPQTDPRITAVVGTQNAVDNMLQACGADARCAKAFPRLERVLARVIPELDSHPVIERADSTEPPLSIRVDGSTLLQVLRMLLSSRGDAIVAQEPATIDAVAHGDVGSSAMGLLASESMFCIGYLPQCDEGHPVAEGTYLSVVCRDIAPWTDARANVDLVRADQEYVRVFMRDPWFEACSRWDVPPADRSVSQPVTSDVPTLVVLGRFDPFAPASIVAPAMSSFAHHWIVVNPAGGHNALPHPSCMISLRNAWSSDPSSPPDRSCIPSITPKVFDIDPS